MVHFPPLFKYYLRHGWNKTYRESQIEQNLQHCIPGHAFWIIYLQQPLWRRLQMHCMSLKAVKAILQGWFSQLFFNALLVCPLISPLVSPRLNTRKKYNLTCNFFVKGTNAIFSKANFVDKGWIQSSWNVVCHRYDSASPRWQHSSTCSHIVRVLIFFEYSMWKWHVLTVSWLNTGVGFFLSA